MGESQGNVDIWGWSRFWDAQLLQSQLSPLHRGTLISQKASPNGGNTANYRHLPLFNSIHVSLELEHYFETKNIPGIKKTF